MSALYELIREILGAGYEIRLSPENGIVTLTIQEAGNGVVDCVEGELNPLQWGIERGLIENLKSAWEDIR